MRELVQGDMIVSSIFPVKGQSWKETGQPSFIDSSLFPGVSPSSFDISLHHSLAVESEATSMFFVQTFLEIYEYW